MFHKRLQRTRAVLSCLYNHVQKIPRIMVVCPLVKVVVFVLVAGDGFGVQLALPEAGDDVLELDFDVLFVLFFILTSRLTGVPLLVGLAFGSLISIMSIRYFHFIRFL
ncbi:hypothetical protein CUC08_Gglean002171 [Alternaria sp. MG1]|nr:hypothetical protein CUC08_Gglean002171 [Alternaria sp. MG1]